MKPYNEIKELLKQEFLKRSWNHGLYVDVYSIVDRFIYDNFYKRIYNKSKTIKKQVTKKSSKSDNKQTKRKISKR